MEREIVILEGARTAWAEYAGSKKGGLFKDISVIDIGVFAAKEALRRAKVKPGLIDHVIIGLGNQNSPGSVLAGRQVGLKAEIPYAVPALTLNRVCASGVQAIITGAQLIMLEEADFVLAGGMDSTSQCPHLLRGLRSNLRLYDEIKLVDSLWESLYDPYTGMVMGETADKIAEEYGITREECDRFAYESHIKAARAQKRGLLAEEIVGVEVKRKGKTIAVDRDDHIRTDISLGKLAKLPPAFTKDGVTTAGSSSGLVDGAGAVVVTTREKADKYGLSALGRVISWGITGVRPEVMGIGPVPATKIALQKAGLSVADIDVVELNEAFAAPCLACIKELGLDMEKVNPNGGSIALGHPFGGTGVRLTYTILQELKRRKARYGLVTMCVGGGQGVSMIVESLVECARREK